MVDHLLPVDETFSSPKCSVGYLGDRLASRQPYHMLPSPISEDDSDVSSPCSCASPEVKEAPENGSRDLETCSQLSAGSHRSHLHPESAGRERCTPPPGGTSGGGAQSAGEGPAHDGPVPVLLQIQPVAVKQEAGTGPASPGQAPESVKVAQLLVNIQGQTFALLPQVVPSSNLNLPSKFVRIAPVPIAAKPIGSGSLGPGPAGLLVGQKFPKNPGARESTCFWQQQNKASPERLPEPEQPPASVLDILSEAPS